MAFPNALWGVLCALLLFCGIAQSKLPIAELQRQLIAECYLAETVRPFPEDNGTLIVKPSLKAMKFLELNDLEQRFSFVGKITISWYNQCVKKVWKNWTIGDERLQRPAGDLWRVEVLHVSSVNSVIISLTDESFIAIHPDGRIKWMLASRFDSRCDLIFRNFPYDVQRCAVRFEYLLDRTLIDTDVIHSHMSQQFMSPSSVWTCENLTAEVNYEKYDGGQGKSCCQPVYNFTFRRKYHQYAVSIFLPSIALMAIQLAFFLMPPEESNRTLYCATIIMAFILLQNLIQGSLPETSEIVLVVVFIAVQLFIGILCTIYSLITCMVSRYHFARRRIKFNNWKGASISTLRLIDMIAFCLIFLLAAGSTLIIFCMIAFE